MATSSYAPVLDRFEAIRGVDMQRWDVIVTVACVFVAIARAGKAIPSDEQRNALMTTVTTRLNEWNPDGVSTCEDLNQYYERVVEVIANDPAYSDEPRWIAPDVLGSWIAVNVLERAPETDEERAMMRALGGLTLEGFAGWWSEE